MSCLVGPLRLCIVYVPTNTAVISILLVSLVTVAVVSPGLIFTPCVAAADTRGFHTLVFVWQVKFI